MGFADTPQEQLDSELLTDFATMSAFGETPRGGVDREAMTQPDVEQRRWLSGWLEERGFSVDIDRVGNQFGTFEWTPGAPYVLLGSHMDSQPLGGKFDGAYGVIAAAEAAWRIKRACDESGHVPQYNIAVVNWFNEEGSRFEPSMMGSGVYTGKLDADTVLKTEDLAGVSVAEALEDGGFLGSGDGPQAAAYAEIHIEQGRILDEEGVAIGLVEATWAAKKYHLIVHGDQAHTGSTIISDRHDALLGASHLVVLAREIADEFGIHTSVGQLVVLPNSPVVVPREARLHLDMRSPDSALVEAADARLRERMRKIEELAAVRIEEDTAHQWDLLPYDPRGVELSRRVAEDLGLSHRPIMTVAGHDSTNMKDIVPSVMLFVPSVDGISHNEGEYTKDADMCAGVNLFTEVATRLLDGALDE
ncbi:M20 family metallo-hydrolase [Brevibacterium sp. BRM-1]|uniref:M20 family metallo-hydrolase n=1 Tax=Brevibacterium sp. BRM-1 TaxID=2999062 RepID=UPI0022803C08|nr:M20 family metallo-hydrolase [Brevibacterium sp. BRM-1]WAL39924.1 M20 family metallo-hydrolase [Brevibacterium sp. BRM-1]